MSWVDPIENYLHLNPPKSLGPGDAISVAFLTESSHRIGGPYYLAVWKSLTAGLRLKNADRPPSADQGKAQD